MESFDSPGLSAPHAQHLTSPSLLLTRQVSQDHEPVGGARCASGLNCSEGRGGGGERKGGEVGGVEAGGAEGRSGSGRRGGEERRKVSGVKGR